MGKPKEKVSLRDRINGKHGRKSGNGAFLSKYALKQRQLAAEKQSSKEERAEPPAKEASPVVFPAVVDASVSGLFFDRGYAFFEIKKNGANKRVYVPIQVVKRDLGARRIAYGETVRCLVEDRGGGKGLIARQLFP